MSHVNVVNELKPEDEYDLVIVLIRKNNLLPVFETLAASPGVKNILFMGNNALGFDEYITHLPAEKLLFGFPGAGGGIKEQVVYYADRKKPGDKRRAVKELLESKFAEVAFGMHAKAAQDEMKDLAYELRKLTAKTSVNTPNIDTLRRFII